MRYIARRAYNLNGSPSFVGNCMYKGIWVALQLYIRPHRKIYGWVTVDGIQVAFNKN